MSMFITADQVAAGAVAVSKFINVDPEAIVTPQIVNLAEGERYKVDDLKKARIYVAFALREVCGPYRGIDASIARCLAVKRYPEYFVAHALKSKRLWFRDYIYQVVLDAVRTASSGIVHHPPQPPKPPQIPAEKIDMLRELAQSVREQAR